MDLTYDAIKDLQPKPGGVTINQEALLRNSRIMTDTLRIALDNALARAQAGRQEGSGGLIEKTKALNDSRRIRDVLHSWVYVQNSLSSGKAYPIVTKSGLEKGKTLLGD